MSKGIDYRFKVRKDDGRVVIPPRIKRSESIYDRFSLPQKYSEVARSNETIIRPRFDLQGEMARKYL